MLSNAKPGGLHCSALVAGIVICLLTGMPRTMIQRNLYNRGKFGENPDQLIAEAESCINRMLQWGTIPESTYLSEGH